MFCSELKSLSLVFCRKRWFRSSNTTGVSPSGHCPLDYLLAHSKMTKMCVGELEIGQLTVFWRWCNKGFNLVDLFTAQDKGATATFFGWEMDSICCIASLMIGHLESSRDLLVAVAFSGQSSHLPIFRDDVWFISLLTWYLIQCVVLLSIFLLWNEHEIEVILMMAGASVDDSSLQRFNWSVL